MLESQPQTQIDPEELRSRLLLVTEQYLPKLPELIGNIKTKNPMAMMAVQALRPFLPTCSKLLTSSIEEAPPERILELVKFVEGVSVWLKDPDSLSNHSSELSS